MKNNIIYPAQMETQSFGRLVVRIVEDSGFVPIPNAIVQIANENDPLCSN